MAVRSSADVLSVSQSKRVFRPLTDSAFIVLSAAALCTLILLCRLPILTNVLYASQSTFPFGSVEAGAVVNHTFLVRNLHPWSVRVTGAQGSCGCTRTFVGKDVPFTLKPLEAVAVNVSVDTVGKSGAVSQSVHVLTTDSPTGTALVMQGSVHNSAFEKGK